MNPQPSQKDRPKSYLPDRVLSWLILAGQVAGFAYYVRQYGALWKAAPEACSYDVFAWLTMRHYWNRVLSLGAAIALYVWLALEVVKGSRWTFVVLVYFSASTIIPWVGSWSQANAYAVSYLVAHFALLVYCALRGASVIGPHRRYLGQHERN